MKKLLNTLYVSTQGAYIHKEGETVVIEVEGMKALQLPLHTLQSIVCFGNVLCSPFLLGHCADIGVSVSFLSVHGRFLAAIRPPVCGNVLLRRHQFRFADSELESLKIATNMVSGKIANCRVVLSRATRDHTDRSATLVIKDVISCIDSILGKIPAAVNLDELRGFEGQAASLYFSVFNDLITSQKSSFIFKSRNRRPPLDEVNALLSFIYTLLSHDVRAALESVGLDPAVGFLHSDRPGRYGLALDLMEEFRPFIADRLVLSLINRSQVKSSGFTIAINGAVSMDADTRKTILIEYQKRKQDTIRHLYLDEDLPIGMLFYAQAMLLARYIRGDLDGYPPFFWR
jgi:CRISP-associated protein Cas1